MLICQLWCYNLKKSTSEDAGSKELHNTMYVASQYRVLSPLSLFPCSSFIFDVAT